MAFNAPSITQLGHIRAKHDKGRMRKSISLLGKQFGDFGMKGLPFCYVLFCYLIPGLSLAEDSLLLRLVLLSDTRASSCGRLSPVTSCFAI